MRRILPALAASVAAAFLLTLALAPDARADGDDGHEHEPDPFPVSEINPTWLSAAWTAVPAGVGIALGAGGSDDEGAQDVKPFASSLLWGGLVVGPATGYWHGGAGKFAVRGLIIRGAAFALASIVAPSESSQGALYPAFSSDDDAKKWTWIGATSVIVASGVLDIVRAEGAVNHVERHHLSIVPALDVGSQHMGVGLVVATGF